MFGENQEAAKLKEKWSEMSYDEKMDTFLWKMVWFHNEKYIPGNPNQAIQDLTKTLKTASISSENLTKSIRNATWVAAIIGGLGIIIAVINLFI